MSPSQYDFYTRLARIFNSGQSRAAILYGSVYDLFFNGTQYVPLAAFLAEKWAAKGFIRIVYELNGPIRVLDQREQLRNAYIEWKAGLDVDSLLIREAARKGPSERDRLSDEFDKQLLDALGNPSLALEVLRQLTICSRASARGPHPLDASLVILIEAADMLLPAGQGDVAGLNDRQLQRIAILQDWFGDPAFLAGNDSVCLIAESLGLVHPRVARLPQVLSVEIPPPERERRRHAIECFSKDKPPQLWGTMDDLAAFTAGLSTHAVRQLLVGAKYCETKIEPADVIGKVEEHIQGQLGEDVVEFKKPTHTLQDVVGFSRLKQFLRDDFIPRLKAPPEKAIAGAAVSGPIGGGKTFIFEAVAGELGIPVLVLKNIRSQWYGQTDVIFERLRRTLAALDRVLIFVDEADTQFGAVGPDAHETERRLTGKIQAMMSDPALRGRVAWLLMTARIHRLSPDIRRPGRAGDLIVPVLDPEGDDRREFLSWLVRGIVPADEPTLLRLDRLTQGYSAAAFTSLRQTLKAREPKTLDEAVALVQDQIPADIGLARRYQTLQALVNCTRRSLLPNPNATDADREAWQQEIRRLEAMGVQ